MKEGQVFAWTHHTLVLFEVKSARSSGKTRNDRSLPLASLPANVARMRRRLDDDALAHSLFLVGYFPQSPFIRIHLDAFSRSLSFIFAHFYENKLIRGKICGYNRFIH